MARGSSGRSKQPGRPVMFWWDNPPGPGQGGTVERLIRGKVYERRVGSRDLLDVQEAAAALGNLHPLSVYRLIQQGRLAVVRRGRQVLIRLSEVKRYLRSGGPGGPDFWLSG